MWDMMTYGDTINERVVRILLECILVFHLKLLSISDLIVSDLDTQSILSMVYKYPKILWTSGFVCG